MASPYCNRIRIDSPKDFLGACRYLQSETHPNHQTLLEVTKFEKNHSMNSAELCTLVRRVIKLHNKINSRSHLVRGHFDWFLARFPSGTNLSKSEISSIDQLLLKEVWENRPAFYNHHVHKCGAIEFNQLVARVGGYGGLLMEPPRVAADYTFANELLRKKLVIINTSRQGSELPDVKVDLEASNALNNYDDAQLFQGWQQLQRTTQKRFLDFIRAERVYIARDQSLRASGGKVIRKQLLHRARVDFNLCHELRWNLIRTIELERERTMKREAKKKAETEKLIYQQKQDQPEYYNNESTIQNQTETEAPTGRQASDNPGDPEGERVESH